MKASILSLSTEVPEMSLSQEHFSASTARFLKLGNAHTHFLNKIASGSQIQKRHTAIADFLTDGFEGAFFGKQTIGSLPKTSQRNDFYKEAAPKLAEQVSAKALKQWGCDPETITHVISVSCTGMIAPGIEYLLIERLGLSPHVERLGINFMGCFGAFKGLAIAKALALENPQHRVLVVCTELCSLHFQADLSKDTMVANTIFADGAAAAIIGAHPQAEERPLLEIHNQRSAALKGTLDLMTWEAGDHGCRMRLSASVPTRLKENIVAFAERLIGPALSFKACSWAVHPGAKGILEAIATACSLDKEQLAASWKVLSKYGNMSSPTFLFVLDEILKQEHQKKWIAGLGFGPGLSFEGLLLKRVDGNVAK